MSNQRKIVSLSNTLKDHPRVKKETVAESNQRINTVMKETVRDFQKKQRTSLEKASQIILNA
ncbi:MAG TPA: hypothetical protein VNS58_28975 [Puia sp.]|nr:hypothetical protein [Puia sp.]